MLLLTIVLPFEPLKIHPVWSPWSPLPLGSVAPDWPPLAVYYPLIGKRGLAIELRNGGRGMPWQTDSDWSTGGT